MNLKSRFPIIMVGMAILSLGLAAIAQQATTAPSSGPGITYNLINPLPNSALPGDASGMELWTTNLNFTNQDMTALWCRLVHAHEAQAAAEQGAEVTAEITFATGIGASRDAAYLKNNPDVAAHVSGTALAGSPVYYACGLEHWVLYGQFEGRLY